MFSYFSCTSKIKKSLHLLLYGSVSLPIKEAERGLEVLGMRVLTVYVKLLAEVFFKNCHAVIDCI